MHFCLAASMSSAAEVNIGEHCVLPKCASQLGSCAMDADSIDLQHRIATLVESAIMQDSQYASVMDVKSACSQEWQQCVISDQRPLSCSACTTCYCCMKTREPNLV